jgi:hypothetical protein
MQARRNAGRCLKKIEPALPAFFLAGRPLSFRQRKRGVFVRDCKKKSEKRHANLTALSH